MSELTWDNPADRIYESQVDRGVLYLPGGEGIAWPGLISVDETPEEATIEPLYFDGVNYHNYRLPSESKAIIKAFTYPEEFEEFDGTASAGSEWLQGRDQPIRRLFGLSYRTKIGDGLQGTSLGYKIHVWYNLTAEPTPKNYKTKADQEDVSQFSWKIAGGPVKVPGLRPTPHFTIDSRKTAPAVLEQIEETLYGTETISPRLPSVAELLDLHLITITDNGDGTWTAEGPSELIIMTSPTSFQIDSVDATYIDANTYDVSTTD